MRKCVVFCKKQTRDFTGCFKGLTKIKGYIVRIIGGIEPQSGERGIVEYWTSEPLAKLKRKYRRLIEM